MVTLIGTPFQALTLLSEHEMAVVLTQHDGKKIHALYDTFNLSDDLQGRDRRRRVDRGNGRINVTNFVFIKNN